MQNEAKTEMTTEQLTSKLYEAIEALPESIRDNVINDLEDFCDKAIEAWNRRVKNEN